MYVPCSERAQMLVFPSNAGKVALQLTKMHGQLEVVLRTKLVTWEHRLLRKIATIWAHNFECYFLLVNKIEEECSKSMTN
jgi:hypothetical protein